jgi:heme exporter protein CcmB
MRTASASWWYRSLLGTPALSLIGAVGAALTLGLRGGGVLITLLVLPLYVPVLIFGAGAVEATAGGISPQGHLLLLGALSLGSAVLAPWAVGAALRISMEYAGRGMFHAKAGPSSACRAPRGRPGSTRACPG